ncbi:MAG: hypothetical protein M3O09_06060, partial [Acidobacteriota bacterium]|nr:hypothetical protein [Acidobacteriota bacterium]
MRTGNIVTIIDKIDTTRDAIFIILPLCFSGWTRKQRPACTGGSAMSNDNQGCPASETDWRELAK